MDEQALPKRPGRAPLPGGPALLHCNITAPQMSKLDSLALLTGREKSALVREALDHYFALILGKIASNGSETLPQETEPDAA